MLPNSKHWYFYAITYINDKGETLACSSVINCHPSQIISVIKTQNDLPDVSALQWSISTINKLD